MIHLSEKKKWESFNLNIEKECNAIQNELIVNVIQRTEKKVQRAHTVIKPMRIVWYVTSIGSVYHINAITVWVCEPIEEKKKMRHVVGKI